MSNKKPEIEAKRAILARRARFIAAAASGITTLAAAGAVHADDASADAAIDDAAVDGGDASTDGPIFVEAGIRRDAAPPQPCLTMPRPRDPDDDTRDGCAQSPGPLVGAGGEWVVAGLALTALRRRKKSDRDG